jgi:hypothetical protein
VPTKFSPSALDRHGHDPFFSARRNQAFSCADYGNLLERYATPPPLCISAFLHLRSAHHLRTSLHTQRRCKIPFLIPSRPSIRPRGTVINYLRIVGVIILCHTTNTFVKPDLKQPEVLTSASTKIFHILNREAQTNPLPKMAPTKLPTSGNPLYASYPVQSRDQTDMDNRVFFDITIGGQSTSTSSCSNPPFKPPLQVHARNFSFIFRHVT